MAENIKEPESPARQESTQTPKKPYVPPKVVSHHQMEVIAGVCGPPSGKGDLVSCGFATS